MNIRQLPTSMNAVICRQYGSPGVLQQASVDVPRPKNNELLVRVVSSSVNRTDCANLSAKPFIMRFVIGLLKPRKPIMGTEFSGVIAEVGKLVSNFKPGDKVFGFDDMTLGSHAEYLTVADTSGIALVPDNFDIKKAAVSIEGAHYAYNTLNKIELRVGQRVLLNGATGGIGSALLQILKQQYNLHVTAVGNTKNIELLKNLKADAIIDYMVNDFTELELPPYDFIFDTVGKSSFGKSKHLLVPGGIYISSEPGAYAENIFYSFFTRFCGDKKVIFPIPGPIEASLDYIVRLIEKSEYSPVIDREYALENIVEAFNYVNKGNKTGNVVINVSSEKRLES